MLSQRSAGILLHPTSLPSLGGIGDLGAEAYAFVSFLAQARLSLWQVLPLSPPGLGNSPYSAISAFAGNPLLISLERLAERAWIAPGRFTPPPAFHDRIDFDEVSAFKLPLLREAAQNFLEAHNGDRRRFEVFKRENASWLEDFVLFSVIRQIHHGATWSSWPRELARREPEGLKRFGVEYQRELERERAIQFAFFEQWHALRQFCAHRGVRIVGDAAIFVNYDSADVWCHPDLFYLDENLQPTVVAGVGWEACDHGGLKILIQIKEIGMAPYVGAVIVHKDRGIAHDPDSTMRAKLPQGVPLLEKGKLDSPLPLQFALVLHSKALQPFRLPARQLPRPRRPGCAMVYLAYHAEEDKIFEPGSVFSFENFKAPAVAVVGFKKILGRFPQQRQLEGADFVKVNTVMESRWRSETARSDPRALRQALQADEQRIAGKSGDGGVGRISQARRRERQHLP